MRTTRAALWLFASLTAPALAAANLTVTSTSDVVNGDTSAPERLIAQPGADGISLREALEAVNRTPGPHSIGFAADLAGQTIVLADTLPRIIRGDITIDGIAGDHGRPALTLDASSLKTSSLHAVIVIQASRTTVRRLRIRQVPQILLAAIAVDCPLNQQAVTSVLIEANEFDNSGTHPGPGSGPNGIELSTGVSGMAPATDALLADITIRNNLFDGFTGDSDGILAGPGGLRSRMQNLLIEGNTFHACTFGVEIGDRSGPGVRINGVDIRGNRFESFNQGVVAGIASQGNRFDDLVVDRNVFLSGNTAVVAGPTGGPDTSMTTIRVTNNNVRLVNLVASLGAGGTRTTLSDIVISDNTASGPGGGINAATSGEDTAIQGIDIGQNELSALTSIAPGGMRTTISGVRFGGNINRTADFFLSLNGAINGERCTLRDVSVFNNASRGGIDVRGGATGASGSAIENVRIINNTIVTSDASLPGVRAALNADGGTGNDIRGLEIVNCIVQTAGDNFAGDIDPGQVEFSLVRDAGFVGRNGNISGDPAFVNPAGEDFHLLGTSPAIDAGTQKGAPAADLECRPRNGAQDIGAYEFGSLPVARLYIEVEGSGSVIPSSEGFECGAARSYPVGAGVTLTAKPSAGWRFAGWSGDADCLDGSVTMAANRQCTATFTLLPRQRTVRP